MKLIHKILIPIAALVIVFCNLFLLFGYQYDICFETTSSYFEKKANQTLAAEHKLYPKYDVFYSSTDYDVFEKTLELDGITYTCKSTHSAFYEDYRYHTEYYSFKSEYGEFVSFEAYGDQIYSLTFQQKKSDTDTGKPSRELVYEYVERYCGSVLMDYSGDLYEDYKYISYTPYDLAHNNRDYVYYDFLDLGNCHLLVKYADGKPTNDIIKVTLTNTGDLREIRMLGFPIFPDTEVKIPENILKNAVCRYFDNHSKKYIELAHSDDVIDEFELGDFESIRIFKTPLGEYGARGWIKVTYNKYNGYVYDKETDSFVLGEPTTVTDNIFISTMLTSPDVIVKTVIAIAFETLCLGYIVTVIVMYIIRRKKSTIPTEQEEQTE